jgi:hypothetical protein
MTDNPADGLRNHITQRIEERYRVARRWNVVHTALPLLTIAACILAAALSVGDTPQPGAVFWAMTGALGVVSITFLNAAGRRDEAKSAAWTAEDLLDGFETALAREGRKASGRKTVIDGYEKKWRNLNRNLPLSASGGKMLGWFDSVMDITDAEQDNAKPDKQPNGPEATDNETYGREKPTANVKPGGVAAGGQTYGKDTYGKDAERKARPADSVDTRASDWTDL